MLEAVCGINGYTQLNLARRCIQHLENLICFSIDHIGRLPGPHLFGLSDCSASGINNTTVLKYHKRMNSSIKDLESLKELNDTDSEVPHTNL